MHRKLLFGVLEDTLQKKRDVGITFSSKVMHVYVGWPIIGAWPIMGTGLSYKSSFVTHRIDSLYSAKKKVLVVFGRGVSTLKIKAQESIII